MEITEIEFRLVVRQIDLGWVRRDEDAWRISNRPVQMPVSKPDPGEGQDKQRLFHKFL